MDGPAILILDASVLINFLAVDRMDLIQEHPSRILITEHVQAEISDEYPEQVLRLRHALEAGVVEATVLTEIQEITTMTQLMSQTGQRRLGQGEASAIAVAVHRKYELAIDDGPAIKQIALLAPQVQIRTTKDLVMQLIRSGTLDVPTADALKDEWASKHRFRLRIKSFADEL